MQCFGSKEETKHLLVISCNMLQEQCERRVAKLWRLNEQLIADSAPLYGAFGRDIMIALVPRPVLGEPKKQWEDRIFNFKSLLKLNPSADSDRTADVALIVPIHNAVLTKMKHVVPLRSLARLIVHLTIEVQLPR